MLRRVLYFCVAMLVGYQMGRWQAGVAEHGAVGQVAKDLQGQSEACQEPSRVWWSLPVFGEALGAMCAKNYLKCLQRKVARRLQRAVLRVVARVVMGVEVVLLVLVDMAILKRILFVRDEKRKNMN